MAKKYYSRSGGDCKMISFRNVWYDDPLTEARIDNVSFDLDAREHRAIFCYDAAERMALVQLLSKSNTPDRGRVTLPGSVSFPLASLSVVQMRFSVKNNIKFLSRLYGLRPKSLHDFVVATVGVPGSQAALISKLPRDERVSMLLALSYGLPFDLYIADTYALPLTKGPAFSNLLQYIQHLEKRGQGLILVTNSILRAGHVFKKASILKNGELVHYDDIGAASKDFKKMSSAIEKRHYDVKVGHE